MLNQIELSSVSPSEQKSQTRQLRKACRDFEAIFLNMMWNMSKNEDPDLLFNGGTGEKMFKGMLYEKFSENMASMGQTGLGDLIYEGLSGQLNLDDSQRNDMSVNTMEFKRNTAIKAYNIEDEERELNSLERKLIPFIREIKKASEDYQIDEDTIGAVILTESGGDSKAVSGKNALGLMQIMPETGKELGLKNPFSPQDNIDKGTKYLARMKKAFGGDEELMLASYNAGPGNVRKYGGMPPFKETINYVQRVKEFKKKIKLSLIK